MICTAVPRNAVDIVWSDVSGMLYKAIQTSKGKYHIDDTFEKADYVCQEFTTDKLPSELRQLIYN